mmetsp:Transcript_19385/g.33265  ORF Transcript_19385/g.33265 Transcript_19385/m.33265 type:complete len:368 (-) Transcript_19385:74-1177(-)|eukprot:CAMPEP_0183764526 /NCGR_PEP_ID=MMETSP0739-20130205/10360_1 /TAXON_ID=385413 /ORGANISM="Thalassiosira miniscula, Strain CCMP1093" /LENGTH=367 /DNA_ID=CAMNT_0026003075 /DNA_START=204 /DNA_END=1307 /DNA_ORIENTATION=-
MSFVPPEGCGDEDFLCLVDLCPFLASDKRKYDNEAVLNILRKNPSVACLRHSYRCGIGNTNKVHPLALVVALGGSLEVVQLMVQSCPEALDEKLSGKRNVLHYAIAEGVDVSVIRYLTSQNPALVLEVDSFQAIPLHLASTYPSSSIDVLLHLLRVHPDLDGGAKSLDYRGQTPLHRACKSRADLIKVLALLEAYPEAIAYKDLEGGTPLGWAESLGRRMSDPLPEVVELLHMVEDLWTFGSKDDNGNCIGQMAEDECHVPQQILEHFRSVPWLGGVRMMCSRNDKLVSLMNVPMGLFPHLLALLGGNGHNANNDDGMYVDDGNCHDGNDNAVTTGRGELKLKNRMESVFSVLVQCPDVLGQRCGRS